MIRHWQAVMYAKTEHDYAVAWNNFNPGNQGSFVHISMNHDIWLSQHKMIVTAWTRQCLRYGNTVTSRTESLHSALKTVPRHSIRNPKDVVDAFSTVLKKQQCTYQHSVENERTVTQRRHRGMLFASVNGFITQFALDKVTPLPSRPCPRPPRPRCPCWPCRPRCPPHRLCLLYHAVGSRPIEMSSSMTSKWEGSRLVERLVRAFCGLPRGSLAPGPELN
jgi:hypothetical protein